MRVPKFEVANLSLPQQQEMFTGLATTEQLERLKEIGGRVLGASPEENPLERRLTFETGHSRHEYVECHLDGSTTLTYSLEGSTESLRFEKIEFEDMGMDDQRPLMAVTWTPPDLMYVLNTDAYTFKEGSRVRNAELAEKLADMRDRHTDALLDYMLEDIQRKYQ